MNFLRQPMSTLMRRLKDDLGDVGAQKIYTASLLFAKFLCYACIRIEISMHYKYVCRKAIFLTFFWSSLFVLAFWFFFPKIFWKELESNFMTWPLLFALMIFLNCHVEFYFHRYGLHSVPMAFFRKMKIPLKLIFLANREFTDKHRSHHAVTPENNYAIKNSFQENASNFPGWSLPAFFVAYSPLIFAFRMIFSEGPYILSGIFAVAFSYLGYELKHAFHHRIYGGWWCALVESKGICGWLGKRMHIGHFVHHGDWRLNNNVFGFFGFPLADWFLGTLDLKRKILANGRLKLPAGYIRPKPVWFIRIFDAFARNCEQALNNDLEKKHL